MNSTKDTGKLHEQVVQSPSSVLLLHHCPPSAHLYGHPRGLLQPDSRVLQMGQLSSGYKLKVGSSCTKTLNHSKTVRTGVQEVHLDVHFEKASSSRLEYI